MLLVLPATSVIGREALPKVQASMRKRRQILCALITGGPVRTSADFELIRKHGLQCEMSFIGLECSSLLFVFSNLSLWLESKPKTEVRSWLSSIDWLSCWNIADCHAKLAGPAALATRSIEAVLTARLLFAENSNTTPPALRDLISVQFASTQKHPTLGMLVPRKRDISVSEKSNRKGASTIWFSSIVLSDSFQ